MEYELVVSQLILQRFISGAVTYYVHVTLRRRRPINVAACAASAVLLANCITRMAQDHKHGPRLEITRVLVVINRLLAFRKACQDRQPNHSRQSYRQVLS